MSIIEKISLILTFTLKAIVTYFFNATLKLLKVPFYIFSICQLIGVLLIDFRKSLVLENGLLPKKPLKAERGLG